MRFRNICFTLNNYSKDEETTIQSFASTRCRYLVYGRETGDSGTPHLQGYAEFQNQISFKALKKMFPRMHIENRMGSAVQADKYCRKEDDQPYVYGSMSQQGKRKDLDNVRQSLLEGDTLRDITMFRNAQQIQVAQKWLTYNEQERTDLPKVIWITGASGTGKTTLARTMVKDQDVWWNNTDSWFDGYDAHKTVVLEELRPNQYSNQLLLRMLDCTPLRVPIKGGFRQFLAETIIITTIYTPERFLCGEPTHQLKRRITELIDLGSVRSSITLPTSEY